MGHWMIDKILSKDRHNDITLTTKIKVSFRQAQSMPIKINTGRRASE